MLLIIHLFKMKNKKAQMEIMGLAIVVVLLVLGMLFAVRFVLFKEPKSYRQDYTTTQLAANMLNTLLKTTTNCNGLSIKELLQEESRGYHSDECNINSEIDVLNNVMNDLNKQYHFKVTVPGKVIVESGEEPKEFNTRERKIQPLTTDVGIMTVVLDIYS